MIVFMVELFQKHVGDSAAGATPSTGPLNIISRCFDDLFLLFCFISCVSVKLNLSRCRNLAH